MFKHQNHPQLRKVMHPGKTEGTEMPEEKKQKHPPTLRELSGKA